MHVPQTRYILGIDPGLRITGYGVVKVEGENFDTMPQPIFCEAGVIRCNPRQRMEQRLAEIYSGINEVFEAHPIDVVALEQLYSHYERPRTAILMGHARGVLCLAAANHAAEVHSYMPTQIKKSLTGNGRAPKEQMQFAIQQQLCLKVVPEPADVADALAAALCHVYSVGTIASQI
jgi:crossover junction endodeoxyribonuclease RuvC